MENLPKKLRKDIELANKFHAEMILGYKKGDEEAEERIAKFIGELITEIKLQKDSVNSTASYIESDPENQRRLTEVMQIRNQLIDNMIKLSKFIAEMTIKAKEETKPDVNININIVQPKEEKIEDYIDVLPEDSLE